MNHEQLEVENTSLIQHGVLAHLWNKFCEAEVYMYSITYQPTIHDQGSEIFADERRYEGEGGTKGLTKDEAEVFFSFKRWTYKKAYKQ